MHVQFQKGFFYYALITFCDHIKSHFHDYDWLLHFTAVGHKETAKQKGKRHQQLPIKSFLLPCIKKKCCAYRKDMHNNKGLKKSCVYRANQGLDGSIISSWMLLWVTGWLFGLFTPVLSWDKNFPNEHRLCERGRPAKPHLVEWPPWPIFGGGLHGPYP